MPFFLQTTLQRVTAENEMESPKRFAHFGDSCSWGCQDHSDGQGEGQRWHKEPLEEQWGKGEDGGLPSKSILHWGWMPHPGQMDYLGSQKDACLISPVFFCIGGASDARVVWDPFTAVKKQHNRNSTPKTAERNGKGLKDKS